MNVYQVANVPSTWMTRGGVYHAHLTHILDKTHRLVGTVEQSSSEIWDENGKATDGRHDLDLISLETDPDKKKGFRH